MAEDLFERQWGWWLRRKRRTRVALAFWWLVPVVFIGIAVWGTYETMFKLRRDYAVLDQRGARATATFAGCTGGEDNKCRLRLPGSPAVWDYRQNSDQFNGRSIGAPVEVVIDPEDPNKRYTAVDVRRRTNQGIGLLFGFSIVIGLAGFAAVPFLLRFGRSMLEAAQEAERHRH